MRFKTLHQLICCQILVVATCERVLHYRSFYHICLCLYHIYSEIIAKVLLFFYICKYFCKKKKFLLISVIFD